MSNKKVAEDAMDADFWFTILLGAIGGGIFGPMLVNWLKKKGWLKIDED